MLITRYTKAIVLIVTICLSGGMADAQSSQFDSPEGKLVKAYIDAIYDRSNLDKNRKLAQSGANVDSMTSGGVNALWTAASINKVDESKLLLELGADANLTRKGRISPLGVSVRGRHYEVAKVLLEAKASVEARDIGGSQALHNACGHFDTGLVRQRPDEPSNATCIDLLIEYGADIKGVCDSKRNCLHHAVLWGNEETVEYLLSKYGDKFDVNAVDKYGQTPLMCLLNPSRGAVPRAKLTEDEVLAIAAAILKAGADPYLADPTRRVPCFNAFLATELKGEKLRELLAKYKKPEPVAVPAL